MRTLARLYECDRYPVRFSYELAVACYSLINLASRMFSSMIDDRCVITANSRNVSVDLTSESVILDTLSGMYFGVDRVGKRIWDLLSEPRSVRDVYETLLREYEVDADRCRSDLYRFLDELNAEGLVDVDYRTSEQ